MFSMMNILKLLSIILLVNNTISCTAYQRKGCTSLPSSIDRITQRRTRSLLLPKSGSVKLTIGLGKALIASSPKGLSQSWEISKYFAGPTTLKDWLYSVPKEPSAIANVTTTTMKNKFQINTKKYQNLLKPNYTHLNTFVESYPTVIFDRNHQAFYKPFSAKKETQQHTNKRHSVVKRLYINRESYLYDFLTNLFKTDLKCAILRSICRSMEFMMPPGYSMIHDIVRLMYSTPNAGPALGNVPPNICESSTHCDSKYENENSFNFLDWILNPVRLIK